MDDNQWIGERWRISGLVQGVGFRPFAWQQARALDIHGQVWNQGDEVVIDAWATPAALAEYRVRLQTLHPKAARIECFAVSGGAAARLAEAEGFTIAPSLPGTVQAPPADDRALCHACLAELLDPGNRRYRHAFIHCTECGPRFSLVQAQPFDRARTTMAAFAMCTACTREFNDPASRRFHSQTISCPACGPHYWLEKNADTSGQSALAGGGDVVAELAALLNRGAIVAIKGTGGFRLACRADLEQPVARLRELKKRPVKPFALMALDLAQLRNFVALVDTAIAALTAPANPIVLLPKRAEGQELANAVAPGQNELGFMLPGTGLEYLLLGAVDVPLVMTSGNVGGEPQWLDNTQARALLGRGVDALAAHNREIQRRVDDSVVRLDDGARFLRRARGASSRPLPLADDWADRPPVLATGGALKNTFCLLRNGQAVVGPHLGDLHNPAVLASYRGLLEDYLRLMEFAPARIAIDRHPDYGSSLVGRELAAHLGIELVEVGHHHAHIASVMAEAGFGRHAQVIGVAFDGLGLGDAGELWGGEFLHAGYRTCSRFGRLKPALLPGGEQAAREPWRNLLAQLSLYGISADDATVRPSLTRAGISAARIDALEQIIRQRVNSPLCSSVGRLFDAVAAALALVPPTSSFEGQAAMAVETCAEEAFNAVRESYPWKLEDADGLLEINLAPLWQALLGDLRTGIGRAVIAARVHRTLIEASTTLVVRYGARHGIGQVALAGGVWQNRLLRQGLTQALGAAGFAVASARHLPANDAGLSLGQAAVAAALAAR